MHFNAAVSFKLIHLPVEPLTIFLNHKPSTMKRFTTLLFLAGMILFSTIAMANPGDIAPPFSGKYSGSLETKTFLHSDDNNKAVSTTDYGVDFQFSGNVFIYQGLNGKAMGTYSVSGDKVTFKVNSLKGDVQQVQEMFSREFNYSKARGQIMLIGNSADEGDIIVYRLSKDL